MQEQEKSKKVSLKLLRFKWLLVGFLVVVLGVVLSLFTYEKIKVNNELKIENESKTSIIKLNSV